MQPLLPRLVAAWLVLACLPAASPAAQLPLDHCAPGHFRNVVLMIPDGCDAELQTLARWVRGGRLALDELGSTAVTTHMANSLITESAAAATAIATGHKSTGGFLGVGPRREDLLEGLAPTAEAYAPLASVLEAARLAGKATGLAVTSAVTHATPAGFYAHIPERGRQDQIMVQLLHAKLDVVFGGGLEHLLPEGASHESSWGAAWQGRRRDGQDLRAALRERGYALVDSREGMQALRTGPVFGLFAAGALQPDLDRAALAPREPGLAECVAKALELLSQDEDGFLLVVEASQVDWGGHANDPAHMLGDFLAFDEAVRVACDFAEADGSTLVLAFPDHNTGGLRIGHDRFPVSTSKTKVADVVEPLRRMRWTAGAIEGGLADTTRAGLRSRVQEAWGVELLDAQLDEIGERRPREGFARALSAVVCRDHTALGWTSGGHTGGTVPLWVLGAIAPQRTLDNTELAQLAARALGVDLAAATRELFVPLADHGLEWTLREEGPDAPALVLDRVELPLGRDYALVEGRRVPLPGLTILARHTGRAYAPREALELLGR